MKRKGDKIRGPLKQFTKFTYGLGKDVEKRTGDQMKSNQIINLDVLPGDR